MGECVQKIMHMSLCKIFFQATNNFSFDGIEFSAVYSLSSPKTIFYDQQFASPANGKRSKDPGTCNTIAICAQRKHQARQKSFKTEGGFEFAHVLYQAYLQNE